MATSENESPVEVAKETQENEKHNTVVESATQSPSPEVCKSEFNDPLLSLGSSTDQNETPAENVNNPDIDISPTKNTNNMPTEPSLHFRFDTGVATFSRPSRFRVSESVSMETVTVNNGNKPLSIVNSEKTESTNCQISQHESQSNVANISPEKNICRRVYFPADEHMVSGFMDPPIPWNDASTCSTEDLVQAYHKACEKQSVKPLPKLQNQLQAINNFCDRNETLTLRGEKINLKLCETLEEVLRRVQFRTIDLENTHLDDESTITLCDMIEYYESATRLNISFNRGIGPRGWQACARMLKKSPCLEHLEARNCAISEQVMPLLGRAIRMGSMLTILHLENSVLSGKPLMILVAAVKMNEVLRELYLAENKLMATDGIQLGNMLKYNHTLALLDVRNNHLQDVGTSHICEGLFEQNLGRGLNALVLWNNQITYQAMPAMARAVMSNVTLETLNFGHNNITNEGIHRLKEGLIHNKSLLRIGLQAARITCEGAVALAEFIAESPKLTRIDLRENDIKTGGLMALSLAMRVNETVTRIDLDKDPKKESGIKDYAEQQRRLLNDMTNYMVRNTNLANEREEQAAEAKRQQAEQARLRQELEEAQRQVELQTDRATEQQREHPLVAELDNTINKKKMNLHLPLTRTSVETLESPAFIPASELPVGEPEPEAKQAEDIGCDLQSTAVDFPPSPMVSSQGRPLLAPVTNDLAYIGEAAVIQSLSSTSPGDQSVIQSSTSPQQLSSMTSTNDQQLGVNHGCANLDTVPMKAGPSQMVQLEQNVAEHNASIVTTSSLEQETSGVNSPVKDSSAEKLVDSPRHPQADDSDSSGDPGVAKSPVCHTCDTVGGAGDNHDTEPFLGSKKNLDNNLAEKHLASVCNVSTHSTSPRKDSSLDQSEASTSTDCKQHHINPLSPDIIGASTLGHNTTDIGQKTLSNTSSKSNALIGLDGAPVDPKFHSSLSLNGIKLELATVLDTLDPSDTDLNVTTTADELGSPEDFERELDAMIATMKGTSDEVHVEGNRS